MSSFLSKMPSPSSLCFNGIWFIFLCSPMLIACALYCLQSIYRAKVLYKFGVGVKRNSVLIIYALITYLLLPLVVNTIGTILGSSFLSAIIGILAALFQMFILVFTYRFTAYLWRYNMKQLLEFIPLVLFFITYKMFGVHWCCHRISDCNHCSNDSAKTEIWCNWETIKNHCNCRRPFGLLTAYFNEIKYLQWKVHHY